LWLGRGGAQALGKYERDELMPGSQVLIALARALDVTETYLLGESDMSLLGVEFRKKDSMSTKEEAQVEARVLRLLERYLMVEEILGLPVEWDEPREAPFPVVQSLAEADRGARLLREQWGLGLDPIPKLVELLESRGVKVLAIDDDKVDGMTARVHRERGPMLPVVVINSNDSCAVATIVN
jgi:transcriptional regulator with XRE-family HTH domain